MSTDIDKKVTELAQELVENRAKTSALLSDIKSSKSEIKILSEREVEIFKELDVRFNDAEEFN